MLSAGAIGPGIATRTVVAEGAVAVASICLLPVSASRVALSLIEIGTALILIHACSVRLICPRTILLIQARTVLLVEIRLVGRARTVALSQISPVILKLRLIVFLIELWSGEIAVASVAVEIVGAVIVAVNVIAIDIVPVDIVGIDVVPIDIVHVHVVAVVIIVAIHERVRGRDVSVVVVNYRRVVPTASPRVPTPAAAIVVVCDGRAHGDAHTERDDAGKCHVS